MEKRKVIVVLSKYFPVSHPRAKDLTLFENSMSKGEKIHTIRFNNKDKNGNHLWAKRVEDINDGKKYLSIREWSGRPYNSEQRELKRYDKVGLQIVSMFKKEGQDLPVAVVNGKEIPISKLAANDGLSVEDFVNWFFGHGETIFCGAIIHFTDFRY